MNKNILDNPAYLFAIHMDQEVENIINVQTIGGMTNKNFLITLKNMKQYVLRLAGPSSNILIDRNNEYANHCLIKDLLITPQVIIFDKNSGIKITEYIPNAETITPLTIHNYHDLIVDLLNHLHHSNIELNNIFDFEHVYQHYRQLAKYKNIKLDYSFQLFEEKLMYLYEYLQHLGIDLKPCHNDLVAENFILQRNLKDNNRIYLIDWEYSGMNDPLWDIASLFSETQATYEIEQAFLEKYFVHNAVDISLSRQKIDIFKILQHALWYMWTLVKEASGEYYGSYKDRRLNAAMVGLCDFEKNNNVKL